MWTHAARARERIGLHAESLEAWTRAQIPLSSDWAIRRGSSTRWKASHGPSARSTERPTRACRHSKPRWTWRRRSAKGAGHSPAGTRSGYSNGRAADMPTRSRTTRPRCSWRASRRIRSRKALILNSLGVTLTKLNRPEEARTVLEESVALNRETGQRLLEAHALAALGHVSRALGRLDRAANEFEQSLELRRAAGDRVGEAWMRRRIAETHAALGNDAAARAAGRRGRPRGGHERRRRASSPPAPPPSPTTQS